MIPSVRIAAALAAAALLITVPGCAGPKRVEAQIVAPAAPPPTGPKATPEEVAGEVPPLRGLADAIPLVPPELIPPEPPADPDPGFD